MNKTKLSQGLAVYAAERIFRVVPEGTHDWEKFVPPEDLQKVLENSKRFTLKVFVLLGFKFHQHF